MLFRRLFLCALLVGVCSGLLHAALQRWQVLPLILAAEVYESAAEAHDAEPAAADEAPGGALPAHDAAQAAVAHEDEHEHEHVHPHQHDHDHDDGAAAWQPADGLERTAWTIVANVLAATGYALLLLPLIALWDRAGGGARAGWRSGLAWGACAWLATFALPALGLPPELPGVGAAALRARQGWWLLAVLSSGVGLAALLLARRHATLWRCAGVALLVLPHAVGAPQPLVDGFSAFGAEAAAQMRRLSTQFVQATALATALYWLSLGVFASLAVARWVRPLLAGERPGARPAAHAVERAL